MANGSIKRYGVFEAEHSAGKHHNNVYREINAFATLTRPDGTQAKIPLFSDGEHLWRFRISPDRVGEWSYRVTASDSELDGAEGRFVCTESDLSGGIEPMAGYPYHFQYQNGTPMWFFGDTQWRGFANDVENRLNRESVFHYVDVRAAQGFNYVHTDVMGGGGIDGQQKVFFDFAEEQINTDFFREMDFRVRYLNDKGITSGIVLAWHRGPEAWDGFASDEACLRYARYIVGRYSAFNVVFIVAGEWDQIKVERRPLFQAIGRELLAWDPHNRMRGIHPCKRRTAEEFAEDDWMSFGDYQQMYQASHTAEATAAERDALRTALLKTRVHRKPVLNTEYAYYLREMGGQQDYVHITGVDKPHSHTRDSFRRATWALVMAGGYIVTGFGTTYFGGWRDLGPFNVDDPKNDDAEQDLVRLREFWEPLEWWKLDPADEWVESEVDGYSYCLAEPGHAYVVYSEGNSVVQMRLSSHADATYRIQRYDPRSGSFVECGHSRGQSTIDLQAPDRQDWVFLVTRQ